MAKELKRPEALAAAQALFGAIVPQLVGNFRAAHPHMAAIIQAAAPPTSCARAVVELPRFSGQFVATRPWPDGISFRSRLG